MKREGALPLLGRERDREGDTTKNDEKTARLEVLGHAIRELINESSPFRGDDHEVSRWVVLTRVRDWLSLFPTNLALVPQPSTAASNLQEYLHFRS